MMLRFVSSTLSGSIMATNNLALGAIIQLIILIVPLVCFSLVAPNASVRGMFITILISDIIVSIIYYSFIVSSTNNPKPPLSN